MSAASSVLCVAMAVRVVCHGKIRVRQAVTSEAVNAMGEKVEMRICSTPTEQAADIYSMLNYKNMLFRKIKVCRTQSP